MDSGRSKSRRRPFPKNTLEESLDISHKIVDQNASKPMKRLLLAKAVGRRPGSSEYNYRLSSSRQYGLTKGSEKSEFIELTPLGESIVKIQDDNEKMLKRQEAALKPSLFREVYSYYKDAKLPSEDILKRVLEDQFKVPEEWLDECIRLLITNARFTRLIQDISGSDYIVFGVTTAKKEEEEDQEEKEEDDEEEEEKPVAHPPPIEPKDRKIFIAHGKNKVPLEQLKKILDEFKVPYIVAIDEPHSGRPISTKVKEYMHECTSAIFIFTADEECTSPDGQITYRPSDNVVYELGAASILYDTNIVIFKEKDVAFASDFSDLGYITFEKDKLDAKAMDLFKELLGFGLLKITVA